MNVGEGSLGDRADTYGLEEETDALLRYFDTDSDVQDDRLLRWSEFQELTAEYEVSLILRDHRSDPKTSVERTSARVVRIRRRVEPIDLIDGVKIVVERIEVVESLGVHVRDDARVDER